MSSVEEIVEQSLLYDFYGELLTNHQKEVYEQFVLEDLSLGEIARDAGISRQGVHDLIKRCDKILQEYENKLQLVSKFTNAKDKVSKILELVDNATADDLFIVVISGGSSALMSCPIDGITLQDEIDTTDVVGVAPEARTWEARCYCADADAQWTTSTGAALFPRLDVEKELAALEELKAKMSAPAKPAIEIEPYAEEKVDFDTFCKSDFRAVKVIDCKNVKKSDKLLQFTLDDGTGTERQILSGIAKFYKPEELIGKTLVAITNLPPRKMMGRESCGMLISAVHTEKGEEKLNLLMVDDAIPAGAKLC